MEPPLQVLRNCVNAVKITLRWRPARGGQVHPPPPLAGPEIGIVITDERGAFFKVKEQGLRLVPLRRMAAGFQDAPPGSAAPMVAHHGTDLPRATRSQELGHVPVGHCGPCRHQPDDGQDRLDVLIPH
jgi:hypothetical protein